MRGVKRWKYFMALPALVAGCSASTSNIGSLVLPTSNRTIDVVLHKAEIRGCLDFQVLQTYSAEGTLIDSQRGSGTTLPCVVIGAAIEAGGNVGAAAIAAKAIGKATAAVSDNVTVNATGGAGGTSTSQGGSNSGTSGGGGHSGGSHANHSGGGDGTNPGGHGNDGGFNNPGNGGH